MSFKRLQEFPRITVPRSDYYSARTCDGAAINTKRYAEDRTPLPAELAKVFSRVRFPQTDGTIKTSACNGTAIGAVRDANDRFSMPLENSQMFSRFRIPQDGWCYLYFR